MPLRGNQPHMIKCVKKMTSEPQGREQGLDLAFPSLQLGHLGICTDVLGSMNSHQSWVSVSWTAGSITSGKATHDHCCFLFLFVSIGKPSWYGYIKILHLTCETGKRDGFCLLGQVWAHELMIASFHSDRGRETSIQLSVHTPDFDTHEFHTS